MAADIYEDAGYSGKDFQRPGIQDLMEDVRSGKLDVIVTYKIDRISRSLKDFYELWEVLKSHNVTFVSATQHFDTSDSMGLLILNILLSFAQFERELTRERTMSKMAGRAEKGLWNGGNVPLGFDYDKAIVRNPACKGIIRYGGKRSTPPNMSRSSTRRPGSKRTKRLAPERKTTTACASEMSTSIC